MNKIIRFPYTDCDHIQLNFVARLKEKSAAVQLTCSTLYPCFSLAIAMYSSTVEGDTHRLLDGSDLLCQKEERKKEITEGGLNIFSQTQY